MLWSHEYQRNKVRQLRAQLPRTVCDKANFTLGWNLVRDVEVAVVMLNGLVYNFELVDGLLDDTTIALLCLEV